MTYVAFVSLPGARPGFSATALESVCDVLVLGRFVGFPAGAPELGRAFERVPEARAGWTWPDATKGALES